MISAPPPPIVAENQDFSSEQIAEELRKLTDFYRHVVGSNAVLHSIMQEVYGIDGPAPPKWADLEERKSALQKKVSSLLPGMEITLVGEVSCFMLKPF